MVFRPLSKSCQMFAFDQVYFGKSDYTLRWLLHIFVKNLHIAFSLFLVID